MIKNLKKRFITIYMVILSCFLVTVLLGIYLIVYHSEVTQSEQIIQTALQNNSRLEEGNPPSASSLPKKVINFSDGSATVPTSYDEYVQEDETQNAEDSQSVEVEGDTTYSDDQSMFFSFNNFCVQQSDFWETFKSDNPQNRDYSNYWDGDFNGQYNDDWQRQQDEWEQQKIEEQQRQEEEERQRQEEEERQRQEEEERQREEQQQQQKFDFNTTQNAKQPTEQTTAATTVKTSSANVEPIAVGTNDANTNNSTKDDSSPILLEDTTQGADTQSSDTTEQTTVTSTTDTTTQTDTTTTETTTTTTATTSTSDTTTQTQTSKAVSSSTGADADRQKPTDSKPPQDITSYEGNLARNTIYVKANENGEIQRISYQYFESSDNLSLEQSIGEIIDSGSTSGKVTIDSVKFRYSVFQTDDSSDYDIVFLDRAIELSTLKRLVHIFIVIGLLGFVVLFGVSWLLASWAITPIAEAWDKQKQFIADASHELKTPLTIIATNTDVVLSNYNDTVQNQSKWLTYIKSETARMSKLVSDLLYIAKSDVNEVAMVLSEFNLSHTIQGVCLVFESVAFEKGKFLDSDIDEEITFKGDEDRIKQLVTILIDNAIVHSEGNASIMVSLKRDTKNRIRLAVSNTHGEDIPKGVENRLFERFFRVDKARNRNNGSHGLGLNIAQSIVKNHGGEISVTSTEDHVVTFTVVL